ncbi:MAG: hypothetical protein JOY80_04435 [Candidatus Dormibacteraeota bacterium]|nr:hypothetical protein [Candidatus Dormibacteraeota bacterium]
MRRVPMTLVHVVPVVTVLDALVAAALAMLMLVRAVLGVAHAALIPVALVAGMRMPVVHVMRVAVVLHGGVAAIGPVFVGMLIMGPVFTHRLSILCSVVQQS